MSRYKYTKLRNLGSVHGFLIHTPDDRQLLDIYPIGIVRELNRMADRINKLEEELTHVMNKHAVLVADVVLRDDKIERIAHLEAALRRIANTDYRGNRSTESQIAAEALKP